METAKDQWLPGASGEGGLDRRSTDEFGGKPAHPGTTQWQTLSPSGGQHQD